MVAHFSEATRQAVQQWALGASAHHRQKLRELLQAIDWLPLDDLRQGPLGRVFQQVNQHSHGGFLADISSYITSRQEQRRQQSHKRRAYQEKVLAYFHQVLSRQDKILLEALRDYELDSTGRDVNWQHHFRLTSYKQIDAFATASPAQRGAWIARFKEDVSAYVRNAHKWRVAAEAAEQGTHAACFSFDDWCEWAVGQDWAPASPASAPATAACGGAYLPAPVRQAYQQMHLAPGQPMADVKRRFRQLTLQHHPDLPTGNTDTMKRLIAAYETLKTHWRQSLNV